MPPPLHHSRSRSRSPYRASYNSSHRNRSISPHRQDRRHHHRHHHASSHSKPKPKHASPPTSPPRPLILPLRAAPLLNRDIASYRPMFSSYLDIQKQIALEDLSEREVKGRWKSFVNKWNRGELAEGWYDPATKLKADESFAATATATVGRASPDYRGERGSSHEEIENEDSDGYGPHPPAASATPHVTRVRPAGPSAPTFQDLALRADVSAEDAEAQREAVRAARKADRRVQKERLEELVPRAEAGTRERMVEKRREKGAQAKAFRDGAGGEGEEVGEGELMGGGGEEEGGVKGLRRREERKRNEREVRKEEILRARAKEREERLKVLREKEEKGMGLLKRIARERFG